MTKSISFESSNKHEFTNVGEYDGVHYCLAKIGSAKIWFEYSNPTKRIVATTISENRLAHINNKLFVEPQTDGVVRKISITIPPGEEQTLKIDGETLKFRVIVV